MSESFGPKPEQEQQKNPFEKPEIIEAKSGRISMATDAFLRDHNEDRIFADIERDTFAVIDGMGGYEHGEQVAEIIKVSLEEGIKLNRNPAEIQIDAYNRIIQSGIQEGGACYAVVKIEKKEAKVWYAGDVEVLVFNEKGEIKYQNENVDINNAPTRRSKGRTLIEYAALKNYDRILIASDGLWNNIVKQESINAIKNIPVDEAVKVLAEYARQGMTGQLSDGSYGAKDNLSIIMYQIMPADLRKK
jgi:serine/threonine protein phosphatase PrpC